MRRFSFLVLPCVLMANIVHAQTPSVADSSPFRPLNLRTANAYRTGAGRPGHAYWQQRVDYGIAVTLDDQQNTITGSEVIHYHNRSPDALPYLWLHLDQNICSPTGVTNQLDQPPMIFLGSVFDFSCQGFAGGVDLSHVGVNGSDAEYRVTGATMRIDLSEPLAPGGEVTIEIDWSFPIPPYGAARMGDDGSLYEIAQWYPRMAVYDDVRGWNNEPYIGAGEFYLEYGAFDVTVTLPARFLVVATGVLQNPEDVLTDTQRQRLALAATSDEAVAVITADEAGQSGQIRPTTQGTLTWRFHADSVRDFAFAASPDYRWDASGLNGVLIQTLYRPQATKWEEAHAMARQSIAHFSEKWLPYPYPHATTVEGPIEGMEYPMLTFVPDSPTREDLQWVLAHEFGHEWFPMIVGSNERLYPWMDEGFNTFMDLEGSAAYFAGEAYGDTIEVHPLNLYPDHAIPGQEQPLITRPVEATDLFWTAYQKPALMLSLLRDEVLGREVFEDAFRDYTRTWAFKHPTPADFFRLMSDASGADLDWFWRNWIYTTARLDQAVDSVGGNDGTAVYLSNRGRMVMPVEIAIRYHDGSSETIRLPVEMWNQGPRFTYRAPAGRRITGVDVDPRGALPDVDRANNGWSGE
jgi:hypothetical protein